LRSILRLDPDVVLVGEIRDEETGGLAVQAALTGHLVLSTVHANDSVSTLLRIKDLGVAPYLIASALVGIVAQRMVRRVCNVCAAMGPRPLAEQRLFEEIMGKAQDRFIYGAGCNSCAHTGYRGRSGIYEIMAMTDELRQLFLGGAPRHELWAQTLKDGTVPLRKDGMMKVEQGITTPYEIMRVAETKD
jgi:general secretion pathway protein E